MSVGCVYDLTPCTVDLTWQTLFQAVMGFCWFRVNREQLHVTLVQNADKPYSPIKLKYTERQVILAMEEIWEQYVSPAWHLVARSRTGHVGSLSYIFTWPWGFMNPIWIECKIFPILIPKKTHLSPVTKYLVTSHLWCWDTRYYNWLNLV